MTDSAISPDVVRLLLLASQGLLQPPAQPAAKPDVLTAIRRMGALQIDTIHVVARSPYLVLFSRLGAYDPCWLDELLAEGQLFEYWAHAACFLPIEDYPLFRFRMGLYHHRYYTPEWVAQRQQTIDHVLQRIQTTGPVRSADFERTDGKVGTWWDWKEEKRVLEYLHTTGRLMIARRVRFQRVYDLQEHILPGWQDHQALSEEEASEELILRSVRALGLAPARWLPDYYRLPKKGLPERLKRLTAAGRLQRVDVKGWSEPAYLHPDNSPLLERALIGNLEATYTTLLSPFDPLVWDRERARVLFNFNFSLECYLPQGKRQYGYFLLPILHAGRLVGRVDAKAYRKEKVFEIRSVHVEPGVTVDEDLASGISAAIQRAADWHGTPAVRVLRSEPAILKEMLVAVR